MTGSEIYPKLLLKNLLKNPMWGEQKELQGEAAVAWRQLFGLDDCRFLVLELSEAEIIMFPVQCTIARDR